MFLATYKQYNQNLPDRIVESFNFEKENSPEVMVDVRKFVMAVKQFKDKLYQDRF